MTPLVRRVQQLTCQYGETGFSKETGTNQGVVNVIRLVDKTGNLPIWHMVSKGNLYKFNNSCLSAMQHTQAGQAGMSMLLLK